MAKEFNIQISIDDEKIADISGYIAESSIVVVSSTITILPPFENHPAFKAEIARVLNKASSHVKGM